MGAECHPWQRKIYQKSRKRGEKSGKKRKNQIEKAKIWKVLSLCPSWQTGLATLLYLSIQTIKLDKGSSAKISLLGWHLTLRITTCLVVVVHALELLLPMQEVRWWYQELLFIRWWCCLDFNNSHPLTSNHIGHIPHMNRPRLCLDNGKV